MAKKKASAAATVDYPKPDDSWRARDDLRTLSNAAEIGHDKKRLKAAQAEAKRQMQALQHVAGERRSRGKKSSAQASRRKRLENVAL